MKTILFPSYKLHVNLLYSLYGMNYQMNVFALIIKNYKLYVLEKFPSHAVYDRQVCVKMINRNI